MAQTNVMQSDYWNSDAGRKWVAHQTALDAAMAPILDRLLQKAGLQPGECVLDIGCGTGASTIAAARAVGASGHVIGLDIAEQLLGHAKLRAADFSNADFLQADAQDHEFTGPERDAIISRFGLMFFSDSAAAFANMARALRPGGRMNFAAWGPVSGNPWFCIPRDAAIARLGTPAPADPNAPGPMAFQDALRVTRMMDAAGLSRVGVETETVVMRPEGGVDDAARLACRVGPAARIISEFDGGEADTAAIEASIAEAFAGYDRAGGLSVPATIHFYRAKRS